MTFFAHKNDDNNMNTRQLQPFSMLLNNANITICVCCQLPNLCWYKHQNKHGIVEHILHTTNLFKPQAGWEGGKIASFLSYLSLVLYFINISSIVLSSALCDFILYQDRVVFAAITAQTIRMTWKSLKHHPQDKHLNWVHYEEQYSYHIFICFSWLPLHHHDWTHIDMTME